MNRWKKYVFVNLQQGLQIFTTGILKVKDSIGAGLRAIIIFGFHIQHFLKAVDAVSKLGLNFS
jgi:hypothetical protein